jgi:hypothetical protein
MHLHCYRYFQEHVRTLLQSVIALCNAPGGVGTIWKYLEALVRAAGVAESCAYGLQTELYLAEVVAIYQSNPAQ